MKLVKISWLDISHLDELEKTRALQQEPIKAITYGELIADTEAKVIVASSSFDDDYRDLIVIPKQVVSEIIELEEVTTND